MTKPTREVIVESMEGGRAKVNAVFDTGSYFTIIQQARLPKGTLVHKYTKSGPLKTAAVGGTLHVAGVTILRIEVGSKVIQTEVLVAPDLSKDMIIGAGTMQAWDIGVHNGGGRTRVTVGLDVRDPDVTEVD